MGCLGFNFNTLDQLGFYGAFHSKKGNQIVHFIFVPMIVWSVAVWLAYTGPLFGIDLSAYVPEIPQHLEEAAVFNGAAAGLLCITMYFAILEPFAGLSWGLMIGAPIWLSSTAFAERVDTAWGWAFGPFVLGWVMQIVVGHAMIEGRRPALLSSLFQSLVLASLFAWMEGLFAVGYRPKLFAAMQERVRANQAAMDKPNSIKQPLIRHQ